MGRELATWVNIVEFRYLGYRFSELGALLYLRGACIPAGAKRGGTSEPWRRRSILGNEGYRRGACGPAVLRTAAEIGVRAEKGESRQLSLY